MTGADDQDWAPPGAVSPPAGGDEWSRPTAPPPPGPIAGPPVASTPTTAPSAPEALALDITADADRVEVGPVEATNRRGGVAARLAAGAVAALMLGGGAVLVVNAASSEPGAASPEAAFEAALAAVEAEDVLTLAEIMEPTERDTVFEAGFDFVDELVRLEVLDPGVDLSSIEGIDLEFDGFEPRVERPGNGLAHVYVGEGTVTGSIDVAELPLGPLLLDQLDADQLSFRESSEEVTGPSSTPLVAVERDGRWYLSLWYTVAENVRLEFDAGLPDLTRRPPTIGGASPEAAVRQLLDDAVQLDLRRVIGSLDPEEMAVLYDYAPLFLGEADEAANSVLRAAADAGWSWEIVDLALRAEEDDGLATVFLESMQFRAEATNGGMLDLRVGDDDIGLDLVVVDEFFDNQFRVSLEVDGECIDVTTEDGSGSQNERVCGEELGVDAGLGQLGDGLDTIGLVTREVDGVWYVSPIRTGLDAITALIEQLEPESLQDLADGALSFGLEGEFAPGFGGSLLVPGEGEPGPFFESFEPLAGVANADLLAAPLDPTFVWDLDAVDAAFETQYWIPDFGDVTIDRGLYATVPAPNGGEVAVVSIEVADADELAAVFDAFAETIGAEVEARASRGPFIIETTDPSAAPVFVERWGVRLVIVGSYGASPEDLRRILDLQSGA